MGNCCTNEFLGEDRNTINVEQAVNEETSRYNLEREYTEMLKRIPITDPEIKV